ncbi:hypothetical protein [Yellowstone lake phycodnavirus 3]|uniref:hypothetical protein n=1 Tax=Yellowstone lake phycodnavirus 3 TaxID=1586715 RepID=UPI0006EB4AE6|nr:hypothetical protein AR677_gp096 [Yellowstone lake phycodnavirus 3]BAT22595.1 hypothetical protein [Yellowstone lake phycodnavirus 3]
MVAKAIQNAKNAAAKAAANAARAQAEANAAKVKAAANAAAAQNAEARAAAKRMTNNAIQKAKNAAAAEKAANNARKAAEEAEAAKTAQAARNAAAKAMKNAALAAAAATRFKGLMKQAQRPANQGPKRNLKEIYDFPSSGTLKEVIQAVSGDVWKHFESRKPADEIAWLVLKSRGQTVNRTPYRAGFIMDQYNWKELYNRFKAGSTPVKYKQVMRYILAMLATNPPYANRSTGNRNKLSGQPRIGSMNNVSFNAYLNALKPIANQGGGLLKAALRTTASGAGLATRTAINKKNIILPIATIALTAGLTAGPAAGMAAGRAAAKAAVRAAIIGGVKSKLGNNPISNAVINRATAMAENRIVGMASPTNDSVKEALALAANQAVNSAAEPGAPNAAKNALINAKVAQHRQRIYMNIGPYAGNAYGTRNVRSNKAAAAIRQYYKNAAAKGLNINTNASVKQDVQGLMNMAVHPRTNRPPRLSNMAWAAGGALLATAVAIPIAVGLTGGAGGTLAGTAASTATKKAANLARQQAGKKAANLARQQAGKKAAQTARGMAASRAKQAAAQGVAKAGPRAASQAARRVGNLNKAKMNFVKKLLNRAARGNHTITPNMINKAVQRAGGDPRVAAALEKGGSVARNLLATL